MRDQPIHILEVTDTLGESPLWHPKEQALFWVDILGKRVHRFDPVSSKLATYVLDQPVTSIALRKKGGLVATLFRALAFLDTTTGEYEIVKELERESPLNRFNDGKCDRQGRFWAGTMDTETWNNPAGSLYRFDANHVLTRLRMNLVCSNGIAWSPDGSVMYLTESFRHNIFAYDFDPVQGDLFNRRVFAALPEESEGFPDGMTVDKQGYVWSAHCGLGRVVRYSPAGGIDDVLEVPVPRVTSCAFGGPEYNTLYITTSRETMSEQQLKQWPLSGSLFAYKLGIQGLSETTFNG
jgi:sugar lactone lactonase YvrE